MLLEGFAESGGEGIRGQLIDQALLAPADLLGELPLDLPAAVGAHHLPASRGGLAKARAFGLSALLDLPAHGYGEVGESDRVVPRVLHLLDQPVELVHGLCQIQAGGCVRARHERAVHAFGFRFNASLCGHPEHDNVPLAAVRHDVPFNRN
jgi:hypothetical protein